MLRSRARKRLPRNIALANGAYGVALINQYCPVADVEAMAYELRVAHHACRAADKILINILSSNERAFVLATQYRCGVWLDSFDCGDENLDRAIFQGLPVLAGVGFKYQHDTDLMTGWKLRYGLHGIPHCEPHTFVPMISGRGAGMAPTERWVDQIRRLIGPASPLAIASGISEENIGRFMPNASHFLVGTSIETTEHEIVAERVRALADLIAASASPGTLIGGRYGNTPSEMNEIVERIETKGKRC